MDTLSISHDFPSFQKLRDIAVIAALDLRTEIYDITGFEWQFIV
jgi:hypothetical protein